MSAVRLNDPWVQAPLMGLLFVVVYTALGTILFAEPLDESVLIGGIGAVVFTFIYGVFLNRQQ